MSITVVKDITDSGKSLIASILTDYVQLDYEHDLEKNKFEGSFKRYGFISLGADFSEDHILRTVHLEHTFQLILTHDFVNNGDDTQQTLAKNTIFEATHDVLKQLINKKVNLPSVVIVVSGISIDEPEFLANDTVVAIKTNLEIQYRYSIA